MKKILTFILSATFTFGAVLGQTPQNPPSLQKPPDDVIRITSELVQTDVTDCSEIFVICSLAAISEVMGNVCLKNSSPLSRMASAIRQLQVFVTFPLTSEPLGNRRNTEAFQAGA